MSHNYIVSSIPYLVTSRRPIYKVPTSQIKGNPYHWKPGKVKLITSYRNDRIIDTIPIPAPIMIIQEQRGVDKGDDRIVDEPVKDDDRIVDRIV